MQSDATRPVVQPGRVGPQKYPSVSPNGEQVIPDTLCVVSQAWEQLIYVACLGLTSLLFAHIADVEMQVVAALALQHSPGASSLSTPQ